MVTCGTDIVKVDRIKSSIEELGDAFLKRIFTDEEISYCESRRMCMFQCYAARFAAKEAVYKALSPERGDGMNFKDIEICKYENDKPYIKLYGNVLAFADSKEVKVIEISISHEADFAVANAVVEY